MLSLKPILSSTNRTNVFGIALVTIAISLLALIDVAIIEKVSHINTVEDKAALVISIAMAMAIRSAANLFLLHVQSHISFRIYRDLVASRYDDVLRNGHKYEKSKLMNYIGNESLQAVLTVLMPALALTVSAIQIAILTVGTIYVSGYVILEVALPIAILYAIYIVPIQLILSKRGVERRVADELRSDFLNNAIKSLDELRYSAKKQQIKNKYIIETTSIINKGLTLKWANAEGQKSVLELCGVAGLTAWYLISHPGEDDIAAVSGLIFLFYRIAPLITRIAIAYQSLIYGRASTDQPNTTPIHLLFDAKLQNNELIIWNEKSKQYLNIKTSGTSLIMGPSGIGKSILLRKIGELISSEGMNVALVGQTPLMLNGTIFENLLDESEKTIQSAIKFGLENFIIDKRMLSSGSVSGGEAMRIALLRNILNDPDILLVDEPFAALDSENKERIAEILNILSQTRPIICVTHEIPTRLEAKNVIQLG